MSMEIPVIETDHLIIRPFVMDDLSTIHAILNDCFGEASLDFRREWLQWAILGYKIQAELYQAPYGDRAVVLKSTDTVIGAVGLVQSYAPFETLPYFQARSTIEPNRLLSPEMGLFWAIDPAHRGKRYASESAQGLVDYMFKNWDLKRIVATTAYDNLASIAVMKRLGMIIERNPHSEPEWFQITGILENAG